MRATLECRRLEWVHARDNSRWSVTRVWSTEGRFPVQLRAADLVLRIPLSQQPTTLPEDVIHEWHAGTPGTACGLDTGIPYHAWVLHVHVDAEGLDLRHTYWPVVQPARTDGETP